MISTARHVALLAPVPLVHLQDGESVCRDEGKVAFGSRAWEVFRELDDLRKGLLVDVYIYASRSDAPPGTRCSWTARYLGHVESMGGAHPAGMLYRPPSTGRSSSDNLGHWAIFWEVEGLVPLPAGAGIPLGEFCGFGKRKCYGPAFIPEGPLLVEHP